MKSSLLAKALAVNFMITGTIGVILILGSHFLAETFGTSPLLLLILGVSFAPYGFGMFYTIRQYPALIRPIGIFDTGICILWCIVVPMMLISDVLTLSTAGIGFAVLMTDLVFVFLIAQLIGFRRLQKQPQAVSTVAANL